MQTINTANINSSNKRLIWLDNLKAFLIVLVVLGHAIQLLNPVSYQHDILFRYIYSFHMPLFIFVSGYACYRVDVHWNMVRRRFVQLIIPYTLWSFVQCFMEGHIRIWEMFLYPERSLWFLYVLFFVTLLHVLCVRISKRTGLKEEIVVAIAAVLIFPTMLFFRYFGWPIIAKYFMFYSMGFYARKYIRFEQRSTYLIGAMLILFLFTAYFCMQDSAPSFMEGGANILYKYPYNLVVALLGIASFMLLFANAFTRKSNIVMKVAGGTLGLYAIHRTIGLWLASIVLIWSFGSCDLSRDSLYYFYVILVWIGVFFISWLILYLLEKSTILSVLLLGKQKNK